jgi:3-hydroxybutyryl-CoA dehydratase
VPERPLPMASGPQDGPLDALARTGERFGTTVRFEAQEIARFARSCGDMNPLHHDPVEAAGSRFGGIIACGPQTASLMMGSFATWFSRACDGVGRTVIGTDFRFRFKAPVRPDDEVRIEWQVVSRDWQAKHGGWLVRVHGRATVGDAVAVEADGAGLVLPRR